jgi:hypothetical protein
MNAKSMLGSLELMVNEFIRSRWPADLERLSDFSLSDQVSRISPPSLNVSVETTGFRRLAKKCYEKEVLVHVTIVLKSLASTVAARDGMHLVAEAIEQMLFDQIIHDDFNAFQIAKSAEVTDEELRNESKSAWRVSFSTACDWNKAEDTAAVQDLLRIGVKYYLKPGDDVADAEDVISLGGN